MRTLSVSSLPKSLIIHLKRYYDLTAWSHDLAEGSHDLAEGSHDCIKAYLCNVQL